MMLLSIDCERINCMKCALNPEATTDVVRSRIFCQDECFHSWPKSSPYFSLGVMEGILDSNDRKQCSGFVFIDFSISYLRFFIDERWIDFLVGKKLKVIIICDKYLRPLANYWLKYNKGLFLAIYHDVNVSNAGNILKKKMMYQRGVFNKGDSLSALEFLVLKTLITGRSCHGLADALDVNIRRIYSAKQRVEKKMGADVNTLFLLSYPVVSSR